MISPASRGIGFALARRVLQTTNAPVVATARKDLDKTKEKLLEGLGVDESRLRVLKLDVNGELRACLNLRWHHGRNFCTFTHRKKTL